MGELDDEHLPPEPPNSQFCENHSYLNFWAPGFYISWEIGRVPEMECNLCRLLDNIIHEPGILAKDSNKLILQRVESNLVMKGGTSNDPILSITRGPGSYLSIL
jgi:hypothetical protein